MEIKNITIAGISELSTQIAWQVSASGLNVTLYDPFEVKEELWLRLAEEYAHHFEFNLGYSPYQIHMILKRIRFSTDLAGALKDADLVHECYQNNLYLKQVFYYELSRLIGPYTILTTNSTAVSPLLLAYILKLDRFVGMQFSTPVWTANLVEVAPLPQTRMSVLEKVNNLVLKLRMIPMHVDCFHFDDQGSLSFSAADHSIWNTRESRAS